MRSPEIKEKIKQAIRSDSRWIVMHSSLFHLSLNPKSILAFKWEFLKAVRSLTNEGYHLAFPAFTFSFTKTRIFHKKMPSEVGVLSDWVSELIDAKRTNHPIYSHVLLGESLEQALECSTEDCFGEDSLYQFFEQKNATIMMLGCDWSYCTAFHYFEQKFAVPYRYQKCFKASDGSGVFTNMYVRDETLTVKNDFSLWLSGAKKAKKIYSNSFFQGELHSISFDDLGFQCTENLRHNVLAYVRDSTLVAKQLERQQLADNQPILNVMILAESNYEPLSDILLKTFSAVLSQYRVEIIQNEYGQMANEILSGKITENAPDFCFLPSRLEDLFHLSDIQFGDYHDVDALFAVIENYAGLIKQLAKSVHRLIFVNLFSNSAMVLGQSALGRVNDDTPHITEVVEQLNACLKQSLETLGNVRLLPVTALGLNQYIDSRLWYLGRIPYSTEGFQALSDHYAGLVAHECGASTRLLILDLDNTLWGGVLGEDGIEGIQLGGDFPGNAFKDFQRVILALYDRGIALALASKNDESLALTTIANHSHMLIQEEHLASYRINWNEKSINILSMAEELGLSLSNVMFVDDNPLECEKVRKLCPDVKVVELPNDPVDYISTLMASTYLKVAQTTAEDSKRAKSYVTQRQSKIDAEQFQDLDDYFASLGITVSISSVTDVSFNRAVQLTNKTNQFNTTTQRYSDKSLKNLLGNDDYQVATVAYEDLTTETEIIGLIVAKFTDECCNVELLLLSCRVLGRSVETAMLTWLEQQCFLKGVTFLQGDIIVTDRNTPVRDIYLRHGFVEVAENKWRLHIDPSGNAQIDSPKWLSVQG